MDLVTIAPLRHRPKASSSSLVTHKAPAAFIRQVEKRTSAIVVERSILRRSRGTGHRRLMQLPAVQFVHVITDPRGRFRMGDEDDGLGFFLGHVPDKRHDLFGGLRVEISRGFVRQQDARLMDEGASQGHALLFPSG